MVDAPFLGMIFQIGMLPKEAEAPCPANCTHRGGSARLAGVYAFTVSVDIAASSARVWWALCDPAEVVRWDVGVCAALDAPPDYPQPGQHVRWRCRRGVFRILHDRPQEVVRERTLRSLLRVGLFYFDETYTLAAGGGGCRLTAAMEVRLPLGVIGWVCERLYLGPHTRATVQASLDAIKRHCEADRG
jgi:hypothetical protein